MQRSSGDIDPGRAIHRKIIQEKRQRKGECPRCGTKLYRQSGGLGKSKTPITIPGIVENGRCVACKSANTGQEAQQGISVSDNTAVDSFNVLVPEYVLRYNGPSDHATVISAVTIENNLMASSMDNSETEGDETEDIEPDIMRYVARDNGPIHVAEISLERGRPLPIYPEAPKTPIKSIQQDAKRDPSFFGRLYSPHLDLNSVPTAGEQQFRCLTPPAGVPIRPRDIFFHAPLSDFNNTSEGRQQQSTLSEPTRSAPNPNPSNGGSPGEGRANGTNRTTFPKGEIVVTPETLPLETKVVGTGSSGSSKRRRPKASSPALKQLVVDENSNNGVGTTDKSKTDGLDSAVKKSNNGSGARHADMYDPDELRALLGAIVESSSSASSDFSLCTMEAITNQCVIEAITNQLWKGGKRAKKIFKESHAYESLTKIMWNYLAHEPLLESAVEMFLASVASEENDDKGDNFETAAMLATEEARNAMEALLFVMQTLSHNIRIQMTACRALVCLATAAGLSQGQVDDGSNSGAAAVVLNAMSAHRDSLVMQRWGLRALYELCTVSVHSESNKRTLLAASTLEGGSGDDGFNVVLDCLVRSPPVVEALRLVWCLSACDFARKTIDPSDTLLDTLLQMLRGVPAGAVLLLEPLLGTINNLIVFADGGVSSEKSNGLARLALAAASANKDNIGLCTEAVALVGNIASVGSMDKNAFVELGGVGFIADLVLEMKGAEAFHEECACTLLNLSLGCESAKAAIRSPPVFSAVKRLCSLYENTVRWQEILCSLIASAVATSDRDAKKCELDSIGAICFAMALHPEAERVIEACCVALRNLSSREHVKEFVIRSEALDLVTDAIANHKSSKLVVLNGCETVWNLGIRAESHPDQSKQLVSSVLEAMREHPEDGDLTQSALSALLYVLVGSDNNKRTFCENDGLEVLTSVILIHRDKESLLMKSFGILASLTCLKDLVPQIVKAGGISFAIDKIRDDDEKKASINLVTCATQILANAVLSMSDQCEQVGGVIHVLIDRMREYPREGEFQSEACRLIWALACLSESVRSKIVALDGPAVLMATLEKNKERNVQKNASEAFNELALSAKQRS